MRLKILLVMVLLVQVYLACATISWDGANGVSINGIPISFEMDVEQRVSTNEYVSLMFDRRISQYPDSIKIDFTHPSVRFVAVLYRTSSYCSEAWQCSIKMEAISQILLRSINLKMKMNPADELATLFGVRAVDNNDALLNVPITPYSDKVVERGARQGSFWIVGSNQEGCKDIEGLGTDYVCLYSYANHFFRQYNPATGSCNIPRDALLASPLNNVRWSFLIYTEKPNLLSISRYPQGKVAALSIINDADRETLDALEAVYYGSNNPLSPKYGSQGLIANNIKINNTVFGEHIQAFAPLLTDIMNYGTSIGYHSYTYESDESGANQLLLNQETAGFNMRIWTDHLIAAMSENICNSGLEPGSSAYIGDLLMNSTIDYLSPTETNHTNTFNAYDEPWRLPHTISEFSCVNRPIWLFGRTKEFTWEYTNGSYQIDMKHNLTSQNLEKLLMNKGIHIAQTNLSFSNGNGRRAFYTVSDNGVYEIRDEFEELLQMLNDYQKHRGLWIDAVEHIFDRLLDTEKVELSTVTALPIDGWFTLTISNNSQRDIHEFVCQYKGQQLYAPILAANSSMSFVVNESDNTQDLLVQPPFHIQYKDSLVYISSKSGNVTPACDMKIYNLRGQHVQSISFPVAEAYHTTSFASYASGIYLAKIVANGEQQIKRFSVVK